MEVGFPCSNQERLSIDGGCTTYESFKNVMQIDLPCGIESLPFDIATADSLVQRRVCRGLGCFVHLGCVCVLELRFNPTSDSKSRVCRSFFGKIMQWFPLSLVFLGVEFNLQLYAIVCTLIKFGWCGKS